MACLLSSLVNQASTFLATGTAPGRLGNAHPSIAPYELLPCADGPIALACGNDGQFRKLSEVLGDVSLADDARFATNSARVQNRPALAAALGELLAVDEAASWVKKLLLVGVPAGNVGSVADGFALATELGLEPLVEVGNGQPAQVRNPISFSDTPITHYTAPPRLGEHDQSVRAWLHQEE